MQEYRLQWLPLFEIEVSFGITITNSLHHTSNVIQLVRQLTPLDIPPEKVAQDPPEVFMSGKGQETSRISHHADKSRK